MNKWIVHIIFLLIFTTGFSQNSDQKLAMYYFEHNQCAKAIPYFEKVYTKNPTDFIYTRYLSCLKDENQKKEVLKLMERQIERFPYDIKYRVAIGEEYEKQGEAKKSEKIFDHLIDNVSSNPSEIIRLQKAFSAIGKNKLALRTLQNGDKLLKGRYPFNIQYAEVYGALNETDKMIEQYIDLLDYNPQMITSLKRVLPRVIDFSQKENNPRFTAFRKALIKKIQKNPSNETYSRLLIWALVQRQNFTAALIQAKSLGRRLGDNGQSVFVIGNQAAHNKDYATARKAFQYIIGLGEDKQYFYVAQQRLLNVRYLEITARKNYTQDQIAKTVQEYKTVLASLPKDSRALPIIREMAEIQAYYGDDAKTASKELKDALSYAGANQLQLAKIKMLLADIKILQDDVWNASLLYMQIEEKFKYEPIGEQAKFKNAKVFYYTGDFKYAQSQLDVLKEATSKLIANDALNLSTFITENLGLDSNYTAMKQFAKADLLIEQHQYNQAFQTYDSIAKAFPNHKLADDILMRKAKAYTDQKEWQKAADALTTVVEKYKDGILADDALYQLANLYKNKLDNPKKAKEYYFDLMRNYPGSIFVTDARKSYRALP